MRAGRATSELGVDRAEAVLQETGSHYTKVSTPVALQVDVLSRVSGSIDQAAELLQLSSYFRITHPRKRELLSASAV